MTDPRYQKLAKLLVKYSTEFKKGDRILLDLIDVPDEFTHRTHPRRPRGGRRPRWPRSGTRGFPASFCWGPMKSTPRRCATSSCSA